MIKKEYYITNIEKDRLLSEYTTNGSRLLEHHINGPLVMSGGFLIFASADEPIPRKIKDEDKVNSDSLITQFKGMELEEAVTFFELLDKKDQEHITATLLCYLINK